MIINPINKVLAQHLLQQKLSNSILEAEIVEDEKQEPWLLVKSKGWKESTNKAKLSTLVWDTLENMYYMFVATSMIRQGYLPIPIEGGWLIKSPTGETYQLEGDTCTCPNYPIAAQAGNKCKHLTLRDWHQQYLSRIGVEVKKIKQL